MKKTLLALMVTFRLSAPDTVEAEAGAVLLNEFPPVVLPDQPVTYAVSRVAKGSSVVAKARHLLSQVLEIRHDQVLRKPTTRLRISLSDNVVSGYVGCSSSNVTSKPDVHVSRYTPCSSHLSNGRSALVDC